MKQQLEMIAEGLVFLYLGFLISNIVAAVVRASHRRGR